MKKTKVLLAICLAVGLAVSMTANSSIAADNSMAKDTMILAKGNGPGNGMGNGGNGPKDGTGYGNKQGNKTGPRNGTGPRGGTSACPVRSS